MMISVTSFLFIWVFFRWAWFGTRIAPTDTWLGSQVNIFDSSSSGLTAVGNIYAGPSSDNGNTGKKKIRQISKWVFFLPSQNWKNRSRNWIRKICRYILKLSRHISSPLFSGNLGSSPQNAVFLVCC